MAGRCIMITGGSGGIGSALAHELVAQGNSVVLFARHAERLERLADELGGRAIAVPGDAHRAEDLERAVDVALDRFNRLDGLAHCIGSILLKPLHLLTLEEFQETLSLNLTTAFLAAKAVLGPMRRQKCGSIVLVSTVAAGQGLNNHEGIAAAKAGIEGLVRSAAITYARSSIRFNAVAPGLTDTPLASSLLRNDASRAVSESFHPLGRVGQPEEIARPMAYLLGPESSWITGQVWGIDGGLGAGLSVPKQAKD